MLVGRSAAQPDVDQPNFLSHHLIVQLIDWWPCRTVHQEQLNNWYETGQTAFGPKESCNGKLDLCNDRKICRKLLVNGTVETPETSTRLSVDCLQVKKKLIVCRASFCIPNLEYCYISQAS
jgi:hypothetical protein